MSVAVQHCWSTKQLKTIFSPQCPREMSPVLHHSVSYFVLCSKNFPTSVVNVALGLESRFSVMWKVICKGEKERERNSC